MAVPEPDRQMLPILLIAPEPVELALPVLIFPIP